MSNSLKSLSAADIKIVTLAELEESRALQRDIHYSISPVDCYKIGPDYDEIGNIAAANFRFSIQDSEHIYFFRNAWPIQKRPYCLNDKDIIPSGIHTIDTSDDSIDQMIREIQDNHEGCIKCVSKVTDTNGKVTIAAFDVHNRKTLKQALLDNHPAILNLSKGYELAFNKPLMRVARLGGTPQLYNSIQNNWEDGIEILGEYVPCYFKGKI